MTFPRQVKSDIAHTRNLLHAGVSAAGSVRKEFVSHHLAPDVGPSAMILWAPAAAGAFLGVLTARLGSQPKSRQSSILRGLVGGTIGLTAGVAWASRAVTESYARNAMKEIRTVRDARWLERHPISYA